MDQWDSQITTHASGVQIIENGPTDFSVKIISHDGSKNVTWARFVGRTARADADSTLDFLVSAMAVSRLPID
jgi:hypothetical protein